MKSSGPGNGHAKELQGVKTANNEEADGDVKTQRYVREVSGSCPLWAS